MKTQSDIHHLHKKEHYSIYELGPIAERFWSYLIDLLIIITPYGIFTGIFYDGIFPPIEDLRYHFFIQFGMEFFYFFLFTWLNKGKTLGQMILRLKIYSMKSISTSLSSKKIKIYNNEEKRITIFQSFLHNIGKFHIIIGIDLIIGLIIRWKRKTEEFPRATQILAGTITLHKYDE